MVLNELSINPYAVIGALGIISGCILGWAGYRRATQSDAQAKAEGQIGIVVSGLNNLIDQLQKDNAAWRGLAQMFQERAEVLEERIATLKQLIEELRDQIRNRT